jgi:hypothetical protein
VKDEDTGIGEKGRRKEGSKVCYTGTRNRNIGSEQGKGTHSTFN